MKNVHAELIHHYGTVTLKVYLPDDILYFAADSFREAKRKCTKYIALFGYKLPKKSIQQYSFPV
jgi:hypothetical protein